MKVVILAGGHGTRIADNPEKLPKPMVEIGGRPILWHIMKTYANYGIQDFVICCGYKARIIKEYFLNWHIHSGDMLVDLASGSITWERQEEENWKVFLAYTGINTMTAARLFQVRDHLGDATFMMTYGDGLSNVDLDALLAFHRSHGKLATVTAVRTSGRFGTVEIEDGHVSTFAEKPEGWINGGFFVLEPGIFEYLGDCGDVAWESTPMHRLAKDGQLMAWQHSGFWHAMDTMHDHGILSAMWDQGNAPWRTWK